MADQEWQALDITTNVRSERVQRDISGMVTSTSGSQATRHLLLAEDSMTVRAAFRTYLAAIPDLDVIEAEEGDAALQLLADRPIDIVVCDIEMPKKSGLEVLRIIRQRYRPDELPVLMLTGRGSTQDKVEALHLGANDYITKPVDIEEVVARVQTQLRIRELQREVHKARALAERLAAIDDLTQVMNRRTIFEMLHRETMRFRRKATPFCLAVIDLDLFKQVNDTYGHLVGDDVLRQVARIMDSHLRTSDFVGRYGGEEFIAILIDVSLEGARNTVDRLRKTVEETSIAGLKPGSVTVSIGVAEMEAGDGTDYENVIERADQALYDAKETGRNRVVVRTPSKAL